MAADSLSRRDFNVLEKIKDPEADPTAAVLVDSNLPKDPVITDTVIYDQVVQKEREIIQAMQQLEMQIASPESNHTDPVQVYRDCLSSLNALISEHPGYASLRNNRAQIIRRLHGDRMLIAEQSDPRALIQDRTNDERALSAVTALSDLDESVALLTPRTLFGSISPQAGKTLSLAHTQRAAIYHMTAKAMQSGGKVDATGRKEGKWTQIDFEGAASRDFALGGRYGNEIAKALAVSTNPTAKLCGQIVREAMKKEYGPAFEA